MNDSQHDIAGREWLVVATEGELGREGRCFVPDIGRRVAGAGLFPALAELATQQGWAAMTLDRAEQALGRGIAARGIHLISDMGFGLGSPVGRRASRRVLYCLESPLQAKSFHLRLGALSREFDTAYLFGGLARFSRAQQTRVAHFPMFDRNAPACLPELEQRGFLVAICGLKSALAWDVRAQFGTLRALGRDIVYLALRQVHPILRAPDYYTVRRRVIEQLADRKRITVYGRGWAGSATVAGAGAWAGSNDYSEKLATLGRYRFCLCFENCGFPGYITEKIYDCFLAGTIPVYLGAPDIAKRFPAAAFVDYRQFSSPERLLAHLESLSSSHLAEMQAAGAAVLRSTEFARTDPRHVAQEIVQ